MPHLALAQKQIDVCFGLARQHMWSVDEQIRAAVVIAQSRRPGYARGFEIFELRRTARSVYAPDSAAATQFFPESAPRAIGQPTCRCTHPRAGAVVSGVSGKKLSCVGAAAVSAATFFRIPCMTLITSGQSEASTSGS